MMNTTTVDINFSELCGKLRSMKLSSMADTLEKQLANPNSGLQSFDERISEIICSEWDTRYNKKFNRFLKKLGLSEKSEDILRAVDKIAKVGEEKVSAELEEITGNADSSAKIIDYIKPLSSFEETLSHIEELAGGEDEDSKRMKTIFSMMKAAGIEGTYMLDPAITRGLDYYTGIVYETFLEKLPSIGSVCSGGRYDNLAGLYMKEKLPGVGSSIGLDRLIAGLSELGITNAKGSYLDVEIFNTDENLNVQYQEVAAKLRKEGISVEVFPDTVKINKQYSVTDKKQIPWGIMLSSNSETANTITLKNLKTREIFESISIEDAARKIKGKENQRLSFISPNVKF